jgi:hypothetical protein
MAAGQVDGHVGHDGHVGSHSATSTAVETVSDVLGQRLEARGELFYSTAGLAPLAHLLAYRGGTTYKDLSTRRILDPLSLTASTGPGSRTIGGEIGCRQPYR